MKKFAGAMLLAALLGSSAIAQTNMGNQKPAASLPFNITKVAEFNQPWRIAFLPDGRMIVTEKVGPVWLVTQQGQKTPITGVPKVLYGGQGGMLGDRRRADVQVLRQALQGRHHVRRRDQPTKPPARHAEVLGEAVEHDGLGRHGQGRPRRVAVHEAVVDLVDQQCAVIVPDDRGDIREQRATHRSAGGIGW